MLHGLRHSSNTKAFNEPLKNEVEVDETYIGGKEKNKYLSKEPRVRKEKILKLKNSRFRNGREKRNFKNP